MQQTLNLTTCLYRLLFSIIILASLSVNAQVNPPQTSSNSRCGPGEITLSASGCTGGTLNWYDAVTGGSLVNSGTTYTFDLTATRNFYVSCSINGSESSRTLVTATLHPIPIPPPGAQVIGCGPQGVFLTANGCNQGIVKWYEAITQNNVLTKGALLHTGSVYNPVLTQSGVTFLATCTVNGCESAPSIFLASYFNIPAAPSTNNGSRCGPGEVTLQVTNPVGIFGKYSWYTQASGGTPFAETIYNQPNANTIKVNVSSTTSYWVSYTIDDACESQRAEVKALVDPLPAAPVTTGNSRADAGIVNLGASGCTGGILTWYNAAINGTVVNTGTTYSPFVTSTSSFWVSCILNGCEGPRSEVTATISSCAGNNTTVTIPAAYALPKGVMPNTVYKGYAPASSVNLVATASGSNSPYQYLWSNGATTSSISVSPSTTQMYSVTVTDKNGCTATTTTTIQVLDVRCGKGDKVLICKLPPGNVSKNNELCIAPEAVGAHLAKGSFLGSCNSPSVTSKTIVSTDMEVEKLISIRPNVSSTDFIIHSLSKEISVLVVYDLSGRTIEKFNVIPGQKITMGGNYQPGLYYLDFIKGEKRTISKIIKF